MQSVVTRTTAPVAAIVEATERPAVRHRDRFYRIALMVADAVAALVAMDLVVVAAGSDALPLASLAAVPLVVLVSKLIGLYDRDELVLHKSTLDESPALFELATAYTLLFWLLDERQKEGKKRMKEVGWVEVPQEAFLAVLELGDSR